VIDRRDAVDAGACRTPHVPATINPQGVVDSHAISHARIFVICDLPTLTGKEQRSAIQVGGEILPADQFGQLAGLVRAQGIFVHPDSGRLIAIANKARPPGKAPGWGITPPELPEGFDLDDPGTWMSESLATPARYPSRLLALLIVLRDQHCRWPGCQVTAWECDIDHIIRFNPHVPPETTTVANNLHLLCRAHHLAKHNDGWTLTRDPVTGATRWTDPTGTVHTVPPAILTLP
jgi:hypothetical protein